MSKYVLLGIFGSAWTHYDGTTALLQVVGAAASSASVEVGCCWPESRTSCTKICLLIALFALLWLFDLPANSGLTSLQKHGQSFRYKLRAEDENPCINVSESSDSQAFSAFQWRSRFLYSNFTSWLAF